MQLHTEATFHCGPLHQRNLPRFKISLTIRPISLTRYPASCGWEDTQKKKHRRPAPLLPLKGHLHEKKDEELFALLNARRPSTLLQSSGPVADAAFDQLQDLSQSSPAALQRAIDHHKEFAQTGPASASTTPRDLLTMWGGMRNKAGPEDLAGFAERSPSQKNLFANSAFMSPTDRGQRTRLSTSGSLLVKPRKDMDIVPAPGERRELSDSLLKKRVSEIEENRSNQTEVSPETYKRVSQLATPRGLKPSENALKRTQSSQPRQNPEDGKQKKKEERQTRSLQFETDQAFNPYDENMTAARQQWEAKRKSMVIGPQAEWILMPGETPPDDRRNFNQVGMLPPPALVEETVKQIKRVFRWCFETPSDAFSFFDIGNHYKLTITWMQRGFYRMNMHELWRCPHQDCCRFVCSLPDDHELHSYVLMDERMCVSIMRMARVIDNTFWKHDFVKFFDFGKDNSQVVLPTCVDVVNTSATPPKLAAILNAQAEAGNRVAKASVTRQKIINKGRDWGIREDWRRYARWLGGGNAWRLLHKQCSQLFAQRERRKAIFHQLCEDIRLMTHGDRKMNSKQVAKGEKKLEKCVQVVKKTEMRILGTLEKYSLHLVIPRAIFEANGRQVLPVAPDLSNLLEVMLDLVEALMQLTPEERSAILLQKDNPEGDVEGLSVNDSGEGEGGSLLEGISRASSSEWVRSSSEEGLPTLDTSQVLDASDEEGKEIARGKEIAKAEEELLDDTGHRMLV